MLKQIRLGLSELQSKADYWKVHGASCPALLMLGGLSKAPWLFSSPPSLPRQGRCNMQGAGCKVPCFSTALNENCSLQNLQNLNIYYSKFHTNIRKIREIHGFSAILEHSAFCEIPIFFNLKFALKNGRIDWFNETMQFLVKIYRNSLKCCKGLQHST